MCLRKKILFSLIIFTIVFGLLELSLRIYGFQYSQFPKFVKQKKVDWWEQNSWGVYEFVSHPTRMWALKPGTHPANEYGYQGQPVPVEPVPGYKKILFLGDSCTNGFTTHYPAKTATTLRERYGVKVAPIIAGTPGYSTYQGLKWLPEFLPHKPDVLVVYFGWNDHWDGGGHSDNAYTPISGFDVRVKNLFGGIKIYQAIHYLIFPPTATLDFYGKSFEDAASASLKNTRVPPDYFVQNIEAMISIAKENDIEIYFIEAPYGKSIDMHDWDLAGPLFRHEVSTLHKAYSFILRETVDKRKDAHLVRFDDIEFDNTMMMADGVHPLEPGYDLIAERLVKKMRETSTSLFADVDLVRAD